MRVRRIETVLQWVSDPQASSQWYARLLGITPTPYEVPYFKFAEHAYLLLALATPGTGRGGTGVWFEVESVDTAYQELQAQGFTFNGPPLRHSPGAPGHAERPGRQHHWLDRQREGGHAGPSPLTGPHASHGHMRRTNPVDNIACWGVFSYVVGAFGAVKRGGGFRATGQEGKASVSATFDA